MTYQQVMLSMFLIGAICAIGVLMTGWFYFWMLGYAMIVGLFFGGIVRIFRFLGNLNRAANKTAPRGGSLIAVGELATAERRTLFVRHLLLRWQPRKMPFS